MKNLFLFAGFVAALLLGWLINDYIDRSNAPEIAERTVIIEEQIRKIAQLATAEGRYGQMFSHKETGFLDYPTFNKSVIVDAEARILVGFDLEGIRLEADTKAKSIIVHNWPEPTELAYEVDMRYFDLNQGFFNSFEGKELNDIKKRMGEQLRLELDIKALHKKSFEQAEDLLSIIDENLKLAGWHLKIENRPEISFPSLQKSE